MHKAKTMSRNRESILQSTSQRENPGTDSSLIALRKNNPVLDFRLLASRTFRQFFGV